MIGDTLSAYHIESELGSGGMGRVYLAELSKDAAGLDQGQRVALKVIHPNLLQQDGFFKRFLREAQVGQQVQHENVVKTYDCDATLHEGQQQNFLVMEYVEGQTLRDLLKELQRVPEELCRHIARETTKGLNAIHAAGVVHRDIKPENVLITEEHVIKIMDLGVARLQDEAMRLSQAGAFVGSLEYAAPEQFRGGEDPDGRADLHALGLVLYELSTGQHPYRDEDARKVLRNILDLEPRRAGEVNPQLSPFFEEVIHTLIAKDRDERFASAETLSAILEEGEQSDWWKERAKALRIETKQPLRRIRVPRETALYGRDDDLAALQGLFDKAKAGEGQVLLVEGEAGIGKTRLVDEFVGRLRQAGEDINFLFGSYPPGGAATASGAFSTAYREQFGEAGLEDALAQYLQTTPILIPAFAALLRGESTPTGAEALTKDSLQTVFVHATRALGTERPTIVLIDDLHFAPEDGRSLFAALALGLESHRVVLIGTSRAGMSEDWTADLERLPHASRLSLHRLGPKDLLKLLQDSFRSERLAHELAGQVAIKSDGNPFFAFEIIRGLREGQFITQSADGTWVSTQVIKDIQIPSSVLDLIQARLRDLSEEERELLDVAACYGFDFDPELVADVVGMKMIPALRALGRVEAHHRLVRSAGEDFEFDHHQVQETLYTSLPVRLARAYHAGIADALEEREGAAEKEPADIDGAILVQLCVQFLKGKAPQRSLRYLAPALEYLQKGYLNDQAIVLAERALSVPDLLEGAQRVEILLRLNEPLNMLARREAQETLLEEAVSLADATDDEVLQARTLIPIASVLRETGRVDAAQSRFEAALELATRAGDRKQQAAATLGLATVLQNQGRHQESVASFENGGAICVEIGDRRGEAGACSGLGTVFVREGRYGEAIEQFQLSVRISRAIGDRAGEAAASGNLGIVFNPLGRFEEARAQYERQIQIAREIGIRASEATGTGNLSNIFNFQGRSAEALRTLERALLMYREVGRRQGEGIARHNRGNELIRLGALQPAAADLEEALDIAREVGYRPFEAATLSHLGRCQALLGNRESAERSLGDARAHFEDMGARDGHAAEAHLFYGVHLVETARPDAAHAALDQALEIATESGVPGPRVLALVHLALLNGGVPTPALEALAESEERLTHETKVEARFLLFRATDDKQHLEAAHELLTFFVEQAPEEYRETTLTNVPLHRDIVQAWETLEANP